MSHPNDDLSCPACKGLGLTQTVVNRPDVVCEQPCPMCGGSGKHSDALYGILSDLEQPRADANRQYRRDKGFSDY